MDENIAKKLLDDGAAFVVLDVPVGTEFGIDLYSWKTGKNFMGIKMIPPGIHFIYYSAVSKEGNTIGPRTGFYHCFRKSEILVKKWIPKDEDIVDSNNDGGSLDHLKAQLKTYDSNLGAYPFGIWKKWISLSNKLSDDVLRNVEPCCVKISSVTAVAEVSPSDELSVVSNSQNKTRMARQEDDLLPQMYLIPETELRFTSIPLRSFPEAASATEVTKYSLDTSYILGKMLSRWERPLMILGELQMAFLCFLVGQVYTAFEHWKLMIHVLCCAEEMLVKDPSLFTNFIEDLYFQIQEVPADMFVDIVSPENFLVQSLRSLFSNVAESESVDRQLKTRCLQLKQHVTRKFNWDFDSEPDDDAPVVVITQET